jgi:hypothetical protein
MTRPARPRVRVIRVRRTTEEGQAAVPKIAVCGGPYANPHALAAMLEDARRRGCERTFCLGDLGGFGADPDAVWPLLTEYCVECIAGNYDLAIGRGDPDCGCGYSDPRGATSTWSTARRSP